MGGRVKPTTKRTKALKTPAAKVTPDLDDDEKDWEGKPKTKRTKAPKTPAAKMTRRQDAEDIDK